MKLRDSAMWYLTVGRVWTICAVSHAVIVLKCKYDLGVAAVKSDYPVDGIARSISSDKPQSVGCYFAFSVIQISQTKKRHLNPILSFPILRYYQIIRLQKPGCRKLQFSIWETSAIAHRQKDF